MKKLITILFILFLITAAPAWAALDYEDYAMKLKEIGVFKGTSSGFELERQPTRIEGIIMLVRLLGAEEEALGMTNNHTNFTDVPEWARGYVNYVYNNGIANGVSSTKFGSDSLMSVQQYITLVLRALNYDDKQGDFYWEESLIKAEEIGLIDNPYALVLKDTFSRGDVAKISYLALDEKPQYKDLKLVEFLLCKESFTLEQVEKLNIDISNELQDVFSDKFYFTKLRSSNNEKSFLEAIIYGNKLTFIGKMPKNQVKYLLIDHISENIWDGKLASRDVNDSFTMSKEIDAESTYNYIAAYNQIRSESSVVSENLFSFDVLKNENGEFYIDVNMDRYKNNTIFTNINRTNDIKKYLEIKEQEPDILDLVNNITLGKSNDYDRLLAIHEWIADNIYFDRSITSRNALDVFNTKKTNSYGYANLFNYMCRIAQIPCRIATGLYDGIRGIGANSSHAWNEAFVNGHWVIVDVAADSMFRHHNCNIELLAVTTDYRNFDPTMEVFSKNHSYVSIDD